MNSASTTENDAFLQKVMAGVDRALQLQQHQLQSLGLRAGPPETTFADSGSGCELVIYFWNDRTLEDVVELPILESGKPVDAPEAIVTWFIEYLDEVKERAGRRTDGGRPPK